MVFFAILRPNLRPLSGIENFFFSKFNLLCPTSQNGRFLLLRPNLRPLSGIENFFSQNLAYSYSFLEWNLPRITMFSKSLNNYIGITVKSRKNDKKFGFFDFCYIIILGSWSKVEKTMKNSVFSNFDGDPEIMFK